MNDIIDNTNNYYGAYTIYERFCGLLEVKPVLNEVYRITTLFDNCINDIEKHLQEYSENINNYTGWNFNRYEKSCKKLNDESIEIPIYIKFIDDQYSNDALSIVKRELSPNKIQIIINKYFNRLDTYVFDLHHELFHALQMYITDKDVIYKQKTRINIKDEYDIIKTLHITNDMLQIFNGLIYYSSEAEQNAQLNAAISYLKNKQIVKDKKMIDNIIKLVDDSEDFNCIYKFKYYKDRFDNWLYGMESMMNNIFIFGYFFKKYSDHSQCKKINISKDDVLNYKNISFIEKQDKCRIIVDIINKSYSDYKIKLYDAIATHCII